jgi:WD40 repeat protein
MSKVPSPRQMPSYTRSLRPRAAATREWLSVSFSTPHCQPTMVCYELNFTVSSPGKSTTFIEFSPNGRFLVVGDRDLSSLYILDRLTGFHPTISAATPAVPTALVWETPKTFYVGLGDGCIIHYRIDLAGKKLVKGAVNGLFRGTSPTTAIALDAESKTLVLSVGPDVFVLRRIRATGRFINRRFGAVNSHYLRRILFCRQYLKPLLFQK